MARYHNKQTQTVVEFARRCGFQVTLTRNQHLKFSKPGRQTVFTSGTPSDYRSTRNAIAQIRRSDRGTQP